MGNHRRRIFKQTEKERGMDNKGMFVGLEEK